MADLLDPFAKVLLHFNVGGVVVSNEVDIHVTLEMIMEIGIRKVRGIPLEKDILALYLGGPHMEGLITLSRQQQLLSNHGSPIQW